MNLTNPQKLMLLMLKEIHEKVGVENGVNTKLLANAIYTDNTWALDWDMPGIVGDNPDPTPPAVKAVCDILDMWMFVETAYSKLSEDDKEWVEKEVGTLAKNPKFKGFDGNNETEYMSIVEFLVNDMGRFQHFSGRNFNSHMQMYPRYSRMASTFDPLRASLADRELSRDEIAKILKAGDG